MTTLPSPWDDFVLMERPAGGEPHWWVCSAPAEGERGEDVPAIHDLGPVAGMEHAAAVRAAVAHLEVDGEAGGTY